MSRQETVVRYIKIFHAIKKVKGDYTLQIFNQQNGKPHFQANEKETFVMIIMESSSGSP